MTVEAIVSRIAVITTVEAMVCRMAALITLAANVVVTLKGMIRIEVSYLSAYTSTPSEESFLREEGELR